MRMEMTTDRYILGITANNPEEAYYTQNFSTKAELANFLALLCNQVEGKDSNFRAADGYQKEKIILATPENLIDFCLEKYLYTLELNECSGAYFDEEALPGRWQGEPEQTLLDHDIQPVLREWARKRTAAAQPEITTATAAESPPARPVWAIDPKTAQVSEESLCEYITRRYTGTTVLADLSACCPPAQNFINDPALIDYFYDKFSISINEEISLKEVMANFGTEEKPKETEIKARYVNLAILSALSAIKNNYGEILQKKPALQLSAFIETNMPPDCWAQASIYQHESVEALLIKNYSAKELITTVGEQNSFKFHLGGKLDNNKFIAAYAEDIEHVYGIKNLATQTVTIVDNAIKQTVADTAARILKQNFTKLIDNLDKDLKNILTPKISANDLAR